MLLNFRLCSTMDNIAYMAALKHGRILSQAAAPPPPPAPTFTACSTKAVVVATLKQI